MSQFDAAVSTYLMYLSVSASSSGYFLKLMKVNVQNYGYFFLRFVPLGVRVA